MLTYGQSINRALDEKLASDKRVILLGEDIRDPYGGAFKITKGLSNKISSPGNKYSYERVFSNGDCCRNGNKGI